MPARSPVSLAVDELLADGQWHSVEDVLAAVAAKVPPGVAHRMGERRRQAALRYRGASDTQPRRNGTDDQGRVAGARDVARDALRCRIRDGAVEREADRVRRRP